MYKKTILIDLDGVLNEYTGNYNPDFIPEPKENVEQFLKEITKNFELKLFTTRNKEKAKDWLNQYNLYKYFTDITNEKVPAWLIIDDRCLNFNGDFDKLLNEIQNFKPWYKKEG